MPSQCLPSTLSPSAQHSSVGQPCPGPYENHLCALGAETASIREHCTVGPGIPGVKSTLTPLTTVSQRSGLSVHSSPHGGYPLPLSPCWSHRDSMTLSYMWSQKRQPVFLPLLCLYLDLTSALGKSPEEQETMSPPRMCVSPPPPPRGSKKVVQHGTHTEVWSLPPLSASSRPPSGSCCPLDTWPGHIP